MARARARPEPNREFCEVDDECRLDLAHLRSLLSERTRVVAFPWASNGVGTVTPVAAIVRLAHDAGALAWVDAVHYGPHGPIDVPPPGPTCCSARPTSSTARTSGSPTSAESCRALAAVQGAARTATNRCRTLRDGDARARAARGLHRSVDYLDDVGWDFIQEHEHALGRRFLDGLPDRWRLHGPPTWKAASHVRGQPRSLSPRVAATRLAERGLAVWDGNYYAVEIMKRLGLPDGAVRVGIVHYNTADEVDRLLEELSRSS